MVWHTFPFGFVGAIGENEVEIVSTKPDPPKVRLAVEQGQAESNLGAVSFNLRRPDGTHDEYAYVMGRLTSASPTFPRGGAVYVAVRPPGSDTTREVLYLDNERAIFSVPIAAPNLGPAGRVSRFYSDDGRYCYNVQGDPQPGAPFGRMVIYDTHHSQDETTWTAVGTLQGAPL